MPSPQKARKHQRQIQRGQTQEQNKRLIPVVPSIQLLLLAHNAPPLFSGQFEA